MKIKRITILLIILLGLLMIFPYLLIKGLTQNNDIENNVEVNYEKYTSF